jgi:hypothetical protein
MVIQRVSKKDTSNGARCKFVGSYGQCVRVAEATENLEMLIFRWATEQKILQSGGVEGTKDMLDAPILLGSVWARET